MFPNQAVEERLELLVSDAVVGQGAVLGAHVRSRTPHGLSRAPLVLGYGVKGGPPRDECVVAPRLNLHVVWRIRVYKVYGRAGQEAIDVLWLGGVGH